MSTNLSKSRFTCGLQCLKRLYLSCNCRELASPIDEATQAIFERGNEVGILATQAFPGGVLIDEDYRHQKAALEHTQQIIAEGEAPAIFEAAFSFDGILVRVDILERLPDETWRLIEVKSTTAVKDQHKPDVAIQKYVLEGCGLTISDTSLMHLNTSYVYNGKNHNLNNLFTIESLTDEISEFEKQIPELVRKQKEILKQDEVPDIAVGSHCTEPYECEFYNHCNEPMPDDWVGHLYRINRNKIAELKELGITNIGSIPDNFTLTEIQRRTCNCLETGTMYIGEDLGTRFSELNYPLYFMDFETVNPAIPRFKGMSPYQQYTFQWSVHVQKEAGGPVTHYEYLSNDNTDPRQPFTESLLVALGNEGHILVYNQSFEESRLREIAKHLPQYKSEIDSICKRLWDLLPVIRAHVYHPDFNGSYSLKAVLPALVNNMSYADMAVPDGKAAGIAYEQLISGNMPDKEKEELRHSLLDYCGQDTLAMVKLLEVLLKKAPKRKNNRECM